jgi:hypothetical protein
LHPFSQPTPQVFWQVPLQVFWQVPLQPVPQVLLHEPRQLPEQSPLQLVQLLVQLPEQLPLQTFGVFSLLAKSGILLNAIAPKIGNTFFAVLLKNSLLD